MENAKPEDKFNFCPSFCKVMKSYPRISLKSQERVLNSCSEMLNLKCDLTQRIMVSSVMLCLELGPINLSVLGSNLFKIRKWFYFNILFDSQIVLPKCLSELFSKFSCVIDRVRTGSIALRTFTVALEF